MNNLTIKALTILAALLTALTGVARSPQTSHPDFNRIQSETLNPESKYYYPKLLESYMSPDTTMTPEDYHYLYYGAMFQEDYNPYRPNPFEAQQKATEPLYYRHGTLSRSERRQIKQLADKSLANNPLNLTQLMYRVYYFEQEGKSNLAKIWKHKLDHLLLTISRSGTGADPENAIVVVYPSHEFDYFNLSGVSVISQEFVPPYYEKVTVTTPAKDGKDGEQREYYFDLHHILEQYYLKHPEDNNQ